MPRIAVTSCRLIPLIAGLAALLAGSASCAVEDEGAGARRPEGTPVRVTLASVDTVEVGERSMARSEPFSSPVVSAEVGGRVQRIAHDVGDRVEAGDLLAVLDSQHYRLSHSAAVADVEGLRVRLDQYERELEHRTG